MNKKVSANRRKTTRWQRFASNTKLTKILLSLIFLALLKLTVFGLIGVDSLTLKLVQTVIPDMAATPAQAQGNAPAAQAQADQPAANATTAPNLAPKVDPNALNPAEKELAQPRTEADLPEQWRALKKKEERLAAKERDLNQMEQNIKAEADRVEKLHGEIKAMLDEAKNLQDKRVKQVVDIIANTKAKQAAQIIENLDEDLAVKVLAGMRGRQAGEILTYVTPKKAAALSKALTEINMPFKN